MIKDTVVISARVSKDIADMIKKASENEGISTSKYISNIVTSTGKPNFSTGGLLVSDVNNYELPEELQEVLSAVGGAGVGMLVYNILKTYLPKDKMDKEMIDNVSLLGAVASGLVGFLALDSLLKKE